MRFPAKALAEIGGKSMIQRVYEQVAKATLVDEIVVATDDERIESHVQSFNGNVVMTSSAHRSGTDRCYEALVKNGNSFDYVINIQGDEPFIHPEQIDELAAILDGSIQLGTMVKPIFEPETLFNENVPKAILNTRGDVLYFSRQTIPFLRGVDKEDWLSSHPYYKHIGIYAYRTDVLATITELDVSQLEKAEALEQLRWLENGFSIRAVITQYDSHGVDTPEDLQTVARKFLP
jgi:3-deoxy-manno-octulosonate cytidylyltransferase (CMP-KDO synthetase)